MQARRKALTLIATDLETALKEPVEMKVEDEGRLCIPARKLLEIVREIDGHFII